MKLKPKIFLLLLVITAFNIAAGFVVLETTTIPAFKALEAKADRKDVERVLTGFDAIRNALHVMAYDYGLWDDTYHYFSDRNSDYIESNYVIDTFIGSALDIAVIADRDRNILWYAVADSENETFYPESYFDPSELKPYFANAQQAYPEAPVSRSGLLKSSLGALVFSSYSVHRSDGSGESPGTILLGRFITDDDLQEIRQLVKVPFNARPINELPPNITSDEVLSDRVRNQNNEFEWYISDINGEPLLALTVQLDPNLLNPQELTTPAMLAFLITLMSCIVIIGFLNNNIIEPLLAVRFHLRGIRLNADYSRRLGRQSTDELGELSDECDRLISQIEKQNLLLEEQSEELIKLSLMDSLTGLGNRRYLDQWISEYWSLHQRERQPLSFILCDIDYFKRYNDHYGHQAGDEAIKRVAGAIRTSLPRKTDKAARYGGEEFAVLLADTNIQGCRSVAEHLKQAISDLELEHEQSSISPFLTISIGITTIVPNTSMPSTELVRQADIALYRAKASGRNQLCSYESDLD